MGGGECGSAVSVELGCLRPNQEKAPVGISKATRAAILNRDPELMYLGSEQTLCLLPLTLSLQVQTQH